jgi:nucleoside-diphosphate-sugar epimerase
MKILVTGGAGYIGSVLVPKLLESNYKVTVIDNFFFNQKSLDNLKKHKNFSLIKGDASDKNLVKKILDNNFDLIIPLAALVGAPLCDKMPELAKEINESSVKYIINNVDVKTKIILPTTNSGYGIGKENIACNEESDLNPISIYGITKVNAEKFVLDRGNSISLRLATVFGMSPRMRLDLLVNHFVSKAVNKERLDIFEGHFKRNFVHIQDVARVFLFFIKNFEKYKNNAYNFGLEDANLSKIELAQEIKKEIKDFNFIINEIAKDPDKRNYIVSNRKILNTGFKFEYSLNKGIKELIVGINNLPKGNYSNLI